MIGLSSGSAHLYQRIVELCATRRLPPKAHDLKPLHHGERLKGRIDQLEKRGFVSVDQFGRITPLEPPHQVVMREVCLQSGLSEDAIRSKQHSLSLMRARRIIAKRLRKEFSYPVRQIAVVLNRHDSTVEDYFNRARAQKSRERQAALNRERAIGAAHIGGASA